MNWWGKPHPTSFRGRLVDRRRRASGCVYFDRPDVFLAASVADEIDSIADGPEGRETGAALGQSGFAAAVGVDDPQFLLGQGLLIAAYRLLDGAEGQLHAIGAPGGADDGGVGADGHFGVAARFAIDQIQRPDAEPTRAALAGALESDSIDIAARAPGGQESGAE